VRSGRLTFPLVPRRRVIGLSFGTMRSLRRGSGSDVAGSRPYYPGDDMDAIDWAASAKLSTAKGRDEFVVRERFAEEAPRIVIVCDRRPQMAHFASPLPWLDKPQAMRNAVELILGSAGASGGHVGYLDYADGDPHWRSRRASASSSSSRTSACGRWSTAVLTTGSSARSRTLQSTGVRSRPARSSFSSPTSFRLRRRTCGSPRSRTAGISCRS